MNQDGRSEEKYRLLSEKLVNESWSAAEKYAEEIEEVLQQEGELDERGKSLLIIAATAFVQRAAMEKAESIALFGVDLYNASPCGMNSKENCPCGRKVCLLEPEASEN